VSSESRLMAGILLILLPTVVFGGTSILSMLIGDPEYAQNQLRQDLWRAGYAHVGVLLVLSLVTLRYVDEAALSGRMKRLVRHSIPAAAILLPVAFFLSVLSPAATEPNAMIYLAYVGAISLTFGLFVLGVGLVRKRSGAAEHAAINDEERTQSQ
jgi:CDP-diglyceride synthetase